MNTDRLKQIFDKQRELAHTFHKAEKANKVWEWDVSIEVPLSGVYGQERIRSLAWRVVEELAEAIDAASEGNSIDAREELIDVGHYLIELMLTAAIDVDYISNGMPPSAGKGDVLEQSFEVMSHMPTFEGIRQATPGFIKALGMALHALKAKPHKLHPKPTNEVIFRVRMVTTWFLYIELLRSVGMTPMEFYEGYLNKNATNHQRVIEGQ